MARKVDHIQRRREITDKAMSLFAKVGYDNVSLIMIAAATGISRTVLYRYFCSKHEVMVAAIQAVTGEIEENCKRIIAGRTSTLPKLEAVCHQVVDVMFGKREFVISVFDFVIGLVRTGVDVNASLNAFTAGTRGAIELLIRHAINRKELPSVLVPERITDALYAEFESCAMRIVLGTERNSAAAKVRFSDVIRAISSWQ